MSERTFESLVYVRCYYGVPAHIGRKVTVGGRAGIITAGCVSEALRREAATCKLGECMPAGRFPAGVSRYNALMWAAELIEERSAVKATGQSPTPASSKEST